MHTNNYCHFSFIIKLDIYGFYVQLEFHPKIDETVELPFPTRLLTQDQIDHMKTVVESTPKKAVGRNFIYKYFGRFENRIKIAYLTGKEVDPDDDNSKDDIILGAPQRAKRHWQGAGARWAVRGLTQPQNK